MLFRSGKIVGHCAWVGRLLDIVCGWELLWWEDCWILCVGGSCCGGKIVGHCAWVGAAFVGILLDIVHGWELLWWEDCWNC